MIHLSTSPRDAALKEVRLSFDALPASEVADLLLSPYVDAHLLRESTLEPGPSMWIVNRSDVYDSTLEAIKSHAITDIARRAEEKLQKRRSQLMVLVPPEIDMPLQEIPDHSVEDVLGHPLAPFDAVLFFSRSWNEDHRASSALSLTRRMLEHPPQWLPNDPERKSLSIAFGNMLTDDASPYVRSYCARVPLLSTSDLDRAIKTETNAFVFGRLLQNPSLSNELLEEAAWRVVNTPELNRALFVHRILAFDKRLPVDNRNKLLDKAPQDTLSHATHEWYKAVN
jgi:hypothetical protein